MAGLYDRASKTPFTASARTVLTEKRRELSARLIAQAQLNAYHEGHNAVADEHVEDAFSFVIRGHVGRSRWYDFGIAFAGVIIGVALGFLVSEVTRETGARPGYTAWAIGLSLVSAVVMTVCLMMKP